MVISTYFKKFYSYLYCKLVLTNSLSGDKSVYCQNKYAFKSNSFLAFSFFTQEFSDLQWIFPIIALGLLILLGIFLSRPFDAIDNFRSVLSNSPRLRQLRRQDNLLNIVDLRYRDIWNARFQTSARIIFDQLDPRGVTLRQIYPNGWYHRTNYVYVNGVIYKGILLRNGYLNDNSYMSHVCQDLNDAIWIPRPRLSNVVRVLILSRGLPVILTPLPYNYIMIYKYNLD